MANKENYLKAVNVALEEEDYYFLNEIFKEYSLLEKDKALELLRYSFESDLFAKQKIVKTNDFTSYWKQLNDLFTRFSPTERENILRMIEKIENWNFESAESIYLIVIQYIHENKPEEKIENIKKYLSFIIEKNYYFYDFIEDEDVKCLWFVAQLQNNREVYLKVVEDVIFNFNSTTFKELYKSLTDFDDQYFKLLSFNEIIERTAINLLYYTLKEEKILYDEYTQFPEEFYKIKIIQRVYINIDLTKNIIKDSILENVIKNIDLEYQFYGNEMNIFVEKNQNRFSFIPSYHYKDSIGQTISGTIKNLPYIDRNEIMNGELKECIHILEDKDEVVIVGDITSFTEQNIEGQNEELIQIFISEDYWEKSPDRVENLLTALINSDKLIIKYENAITKFFTHSFSRTKLLVNRLFTYLERKIKILTEEFSYPDRDLYKFLLKNEMYQNKKFIEIFFSMKVNKLSVNSSFRNELSVNFIDLNTYINTSLGRYFDSIEEIPKEYQISHLKNNIKIKIEELESNYKEYVQGRFLYLYNLDSELKPTIEIFQGFSHRFIILNTSEYLDFFRDIAISISKSSFNDDFSSDNFSLLLLQKINPEIFENEAMDKEYSTKIFIRIIYIYFNSNFNLPFFDKWLTWFFEHKYVLSDFIRQIIYSISEVDDEKLKIIVSIFERNNTFKDNYVDNYTLEYIDNMGSLTHNKLKLLTTLIILVIKKGLVRVTFSFLEMLDDLLSQLESHGERELLENLLDCLEGFLLEKDFSKLKLKYKYF